MNTIASLLDAGIEEILGLVSRLRHCADGIGRSLYREVADRNYVLDIGVGLSSCHQRSRVARGSPSDAHLGRVFHVPAQRDHSLRD